MEAITKETKTNEETLLYFIHDLFDSRKLPEHLIFLENWAGKLLVNQSHKKQLTAPDLLFFSTKFLKLITICFELQHTDSKHLLYFQELVKIPEDFISKEQKALCFYPNHLKTKEICNPLIVLSALSKNHTLDFYKEVFDYWINKGLDKEGEQKNNKRVFPMYTRLKRMIEACWLIHERAISKNSYPSLSPEIITHPFSSSCPILLQDQYLDNPYLMIELFYSFASLDEYKEDLTHWFKTALNDEVRDENPNDLLFIHNQFIQLIQAGYLIGSSKLVYQPKMNYSAHHATFGHWMLARIKNQYTIQALSPHYRENPLDFCADTLSIEQVTQLRYGLKEWLEAALSKKDSITSLGHVYLFNQYEELQKILEALFLLIIHPALSNESLTINPN